MFGIKKKLGALLPNDVSFFSVYYESIWYVQGECLDRVSSSISYRQRIDRVGIQSWPKSAREALQNVLTVEWSGHKTVLVQVPDAQSTRSNEVEMSGMGESGGGYGRLIDDEEVGWLDLFPSRGQMEVLTVQGESTRFNTSRGYFDQPRSQYMYEDETPPIPPPKPIYNIESRSSSYQSQKYNRQNVQDQQYRAKNPFSSVNDEMADYENMYSAYPDHRLKKPFEEKEKDRGWHTFGQDDKVKIGNGNGNGNIWAGHNWGIGNGEGQTSPTSSTATRHSATVQQMDDPFRN